MVLSSENIKVFCRVRPLNEREGGLAAVSGGAGGSAQSSAERRAARSCLSVLHAAGDAGDAEEGTAGDDDTAPKVLKYLGKGQPRYFNFDYVFDPASTQSEVFQRVGAPLCANILQGYNATIFAYGQTGSGKTHTILGPPEDGGGGADAGADAGADGDGGAAAADDAAGILPRTFACLFDGMARAERKAGGALAHLCRVSFIEAILANMLQAIPFLYNFP